MRSLFVLSLPRCLSSEVHKACCAGLRLASPSWTTDGEILNLDRFALQGVQSSAFPKFILPRHGTIFADATQFLEHVFVDEGFCYKDVVQPFIASSWLARRSGTPVLKIRPNIAHAAYAMLQRKWLYPTIIGRQDGPVPAMMVEGLLMAEAALDGVPGEEVALDELMDGFSPLAQALTRLYPDVPLAPFSRPPDAERRRDEVLARRNLDAFKQLDDLVCEVRERWASAPRPGVQQPVGS